MHSYFKEKKDSLLACGQQQQTYFKMMEWAKGRRRRSPRVAKTEVCCWAGGAVRRPMQLVAKSIAKNIGLQLIHFVPSCNKILASTRQVKKAKKLFTYLSKHLNSQSQLQRNNSRAKSLLLRKSSDEKPRHLLTTRHSKSSSGYVFSVFSTFALSALARRHWAKKSQTACRHIRASQLCPRRRRGPYAHLTI